MPAVLAENICCRTAETLECIEVARLKKELCAVVSLPLNQNKCCPGHLIIAAQKRHGNIILKVVAIVVQRQSAGFKIVDAGRTFGCLTGSTQRRHQYSGKNGDDGDHDQKFNQRER